MPRSFRKAFVLAAFGLALGTAAPVWAVEGEEARGTGSSAPAPDPATPPTDDEEATVADDATHLEALAFPGVRYRDAVRLHFQSRFVPDAHLGPGHASLYRPDLRGRVTIPVSERAVLRVSARGGMGRYEYRGPDLFFDDSLDLYQTRLAVQGAYRLNDADQRLLRPGERWSLLASLQGGSDFESGAFDDGLSGGGDLALGYEIPGTLRVAAGASITVQDGGVDVGPTGFLRWNVSEAVTLRNRGLGLQLEYRWSPRLELFVSGFRSTDTYALDTVGSGVFPGIGLVPPVAVDDLVLRDRMLLSGAGFEWKLSQHLRLNTEAGVVAWRRLRVASDDFGTLISRRGDPSLYVEVRFEVRP